MPCLCCLRVYYSINIQHIPLPILNESHSFLQCYLEGNSGICLKWGFDQNVLVTELVQLFLDEDPFLSLAIFFLMWKGGKVSKNNNCTSAMMDLRVASANLANCWWFPIQCVVLRD